MLLGKRMSSLNPLSGGSKSDSRDSHSTPVPRRKDSSISRDSRGSRNSKSSHPSDPVSGERSSGPSRREVGPWLKTLMRAESVRDAHAQEALETLRQVERQIGGYLLASDIQNYLDHLPARDSKGRAYNKDRGYGLAAELFLQEAYRQIEAIERENRPLGPSLFSDYMAEIMDCFFARRNVTKGVEAPLALSERLLHKAVDSPLYREQYLALAQTAVKRLVENASVRHEKDILAARAAVRRERSGDSVFPSEGSLPQIYPGIDRPMMVYLREAQRKFGQIHQAFGRYTESRAVNVHEGNGNGHPQQRFEDMQGLVRLVHGIEYHAFTGFLKERLGALRERMGQGQGADMFRAAAAHYELQGDKEKELRFTTLCTDRYKRAGRLYQVAGDGAGAQRIAQKAQDPGPVLRTA